jgi:hypothetical protein
MDNEEIVKRMGRFIDVAKSQTSLDIDKILEPAIGNTASKVLGLLIGELIIKIGAEKTDEILCQAVSTINAGIKAASNG